MGRNATKELTRIVETISAYIDHAEHDATLSVSYEAIEKATGVSRGHLSRRKEPEIVALVKRVAALKQSRRDGPGGPPTEAPRELLRTRQDSGTLAALGDEVLEKIVQRELRELARLQQQWVARHARSNVHDAPLALHDADDLMRRLRAAVERLRPAVGEWTRRQGERGPGEVPDEAIQLPSGILDSELPPDQTGGAAAPRTSAARSAPREAGTG